MLKVLFSLILINVIPLTAFSQPSNYSINDHIINQLPDNVTVVGLGDPTHQESTITSYRIELIKKLVEEKDFKVILLEGNLFEFYQAHQSFVKNGAISNYEKAMYGQLNANEMEALYEFVFEENKKGNPVSILGFDSRFSGETYTIEAEKILNEANILSEKERQDFLKYLKKANITNLIALFRNDKKVKCKVTQYCEKILSNYNSNNLQESYFFQSLKNIIVRFQNCDTTDTDDFEMAKNVLFIQKSMPNEKIILFGSSTHLLKNPQEIETNFFKNNRSTTLGDNLFEQLGDSYFYIAYTSLSGSAFNPFSNKSKEIEVPVDESIENNFYNKEENAFFITSNSFPLNENVSCRFLGHSFVTLNLWQVMDGLVLVRNVEPFKIKKP